MASKTHLQYQQSVHNWFRRNADDANVREQLEHLAKQAMILWQLDLGAARPHLEKCYAPRYDGQVLWNPVTMLRALLLSILCDKPGINAWVKELSSNRTLRVLAGFNPDADIKHRPGVGTFYDFLHRLNDGQVRKSCEHVERPSERERRATRNPRRLKSKDKKAKEEQKKKKRKSRRLRGPTPPSEQQVKRVTEKLVAEIEARKEQDNPDNLMGRMADILMEVAVLESARLGLLGDIDKMIIGGDGSKMKTGANSRGKRVCQHSPNERCDCERIYSDPTAEWGWDNHNEKYFFGHHLYELSSSTSGHDLPLAITLGPGNDSDFTASLETFEVFQKCMRKHLGKDWYPKVFIGDAGHDSEPIHRYFYKMGTQVVIPLKQKARSTHPNRPTLELSARGVPLCKGGVEMTHWGGAGPGRVNFLCPVRAKKLQRCPLAPDTDPDWHCRPDKPYGPTVTVRIAHNPRLFPGIPRNSQRWQELYNLRSGTERSNSMKKCSYKLHSAGHRRHSLWLIRLYLMAILQHGRVWVKNVDSSRFVDFLLGKVEDSEQQAA